MPQQQHQRHKYQGQEQQQQQRYQEEQHHYSRGGQQQQQQSAHASSEGDEGSKFGQKAMRGEWEEIPAQVFDIPEEMILHFEGASCNIVNAHGDLVESLTEEHGLTAIRVYPQYRCFVIRARVMFERARQPLEEGRGFEIRGLER